MGNKTGSDIIVERELVTDDLIEAMESAIEKIVGVASNPIKAVAKAIPNRPNRHARRKVAALARRQKVKHE